jgi:DMSO/TMAO reductase YedYZ molybdopterin-dependent catalytic subunit
MTGMTVSRAALLSLLISSTALAAPAVGPVLEVAGAVAKPGALKLAELEAMEPVTATWSSHGESHQVHGVALDKLLTRLGFEVGVMGKDVPKRDKRKGWRMAIRASAPDGFEAILSCAEVFESMGATRAMIVWKVDGKPLPADRGPLRLVVLTDKEPSRSVHSVRKLEVLDLRSPERPAK